MRAKDTDCAGSSAEHDPPLIPPTASFLELMIDGSRCQDSRANLICMQGEEDPVLQISLGIGRVLRREGYST